MLGDNFIWVALAITIAGNSLYLRDTLKGETKPNRVTFFLWGAAPMIAYFSQKSAGGGKQILYTLLISILPFIILAASFVDKKAYWKITKFDLACGFLSVVALVLLITTSAPVLALFLAIIADFFAAFPTIIKSYKHPSTETRSAYAIEIASSILILLTIHHWTVQNYLFALYILFSNLLFTSLLTFSPNKETS